MPGLIRVEGVSVSFGATRALAGVSFSCDPGVTGLLGPNGAGKTTLLSVMSGGRRPDSGEVEVDPRAGNGTAGHADGASVGYLPERFDLAGGMRVVDIVCYAAWCNGVARRQLVDAADAALGAVELDVRRRDRARVLSGGQRQRLGLAAAIAHNPDVLLLDEPTAGLDPDQRVNFRGYLHAISDSVAVVLATHLLDDVQQAAQDLLVLSDGRIAFSGKPAELAAIGREQPGGLASDVESGYRAVIAEADRGDSR